MCVCVCHTYVTSVTRISQSVCPQVNSYAPVSMCVCARACVYLCVGVNSPPSAFTGVCVCVFMNLPVPASASAPAPAPARACVCVCVGVGMYMVHLEMER